MPPYALRFSKRVEKELGALPLEIRERLVRAAESLPVDPRPSGCKKIVGEERAYRIRVGNYRMVYEVHDGELVILVVRAGHRRDVYR